MKWDLIILPNYLVLTVKGVVVTVEKLFLHLSTASHRCIKVMDVKLHTSLSLASDRRESLLHILIALPLRPQSSATTAEVPEHVAGKRILDGLNYSSILTAATASVNFYS
jgi:hypothetical protein